MLVRLWIVLMLAVFAGGVSAHETMFGLGPRTIWNQGLEIELEQEFEVTRFFFSGDNHDENPHDRKSFMWMWEAGITYGVSRDWAVRAKLPFMYMKETTKTASHSMFGLGDAHVAAAYRFFNHPYTGGSTKAGWFAELHIPTGDRHESDDMPMEPGVPPTHDGNWGLRYGLSVATSSTRHYLWMDFAVTGYANENGTGKGPTFQQHTAYAYRLFEVNDHRSFDVIMLVEADFKFQHQGMKDGTRNDNSGGYFIHAALGFQMNITNKIELKFGYNYPVYKYLFGRQFYHEGEGMIMLSYLF